MADYLKATAKVPPSFSFDGMRVRPGDRFTSDSPRMTRTLLAMGLAEIVDGSSWNIEATVPVETPMATPRKRGRPKGSYKRRDMRAEG